MAFTSTSNKKCPLCKKGNISLHSIFRAKTDTAECDSCGAVATFTLNGEMIECLSKKEYDSNKCSNCKKQLGEHINGYVTSGVELCQKCKKGCYEWENDQTPGFKGSSQTKCCNCHE